MGNNIRNLFAAILSAGAIVLFGGSCVAHENNNVIIINNNASPNYSSDYNYGVMCTEHGGICASGRYMMSTSRVRYVAPQWKRQTIRERRLSEGVERVPYAYRQTYYR